MGLESRLAEELIRNHPERAAAVLEGLEVGMAAALLERQAPERGAALLAAMPTHLAAACLGALPPEQGAACLDALDLDVAARPLRHAAADGERLLARVAPRRGRALRSLLAFPPGSAGALMDPEVLALPADLSVEQALVQVRREPEHARDDLFVVDREGRLVGGLSLRKLLLAAPKAALGDLLAGDPGRVSVQAPESAVRAHPAWAEARALPVVDASGRYLGAILYRTLRELERGAREGARDGADTAEALGALFAAGARGLVEAVAGGGRTRPARRAGSPGAGGALPHGA